MNFQFRHIFSSNTRYISYCEIQIANKQIEIYCGETSLDPELDLRTVKHMIWKKFTAIELQYRRRKSED